MDTGWVRVLNDAGRSAIMIDLPAHGDSAAPADAGAYAPSRMRADILQALFDERVLPLEADSATSGVDERFLAIPPSGRFGLAPPPVAKAIANANAVASSKANRSFRISPPLGVLQGATTL